LFQDPRKICGKNLRHETSPGLPDGFFSNQKSQFGYILEGPRLENVDTFYGHLEYFTDIWDILGPFGTFCDNLVHFSNFGMLCQENSGNPVANLAPVLRVQFCVKGFHVFGRVLFALACASQTGKLKKGICMYMCRCFFLMHYTKVARKEFKRYVG
jgi:hypothetical protein